MPEKVVDPNFTFAVSWSLVLPVTLGFTAIAALMTFLIIRVHRRRIQTGQESMVGEIGVAATPIGPGRRPRKIAGYFWNALSRESIPEGSKVEVVAIRGSTVTVAARKTEPV
ncbi:MAG: hypothetical protein M5R36_20520 [Deltaproteobacteria bacterium]|nr:hypothetical protein [Deltaproteobacteria bacterium]